MNLNKKEKQQTESEAENEVRALWELGLTIWMWFPIATILIIGIVLYLLT